MEFLYNLTDERKCSKFWPYRTETRSTTSRCAGFSELGTAHRVKMFRFQRNGGRRTASRCSGFRELRDGAQLKDFQVSATWGRRTASRFSGFTELRDGAQRHDVQASAKWGTAHRVNMFSLQRTEGRRTTSSACLLPPQSDGEASMRWVKHRGIKTYGRVKIQLQVILTWALEVSGLSGSRSGYLTPLWKGRNKGKLGRRTSWKFEVKRKLLHFQRIEPRFMASGYSL